jgi:hypothetical protein
MAVKIVGKVASVRVVTGEIFQGVVDEVCDKFIAMSDVNIYNASRNGIDAYSLKDIFYIPIDKITFISVEPDKK